MNSSDHTIILEIYKGFQWTILINEINLTVYIDYLFLMSFSKQELLFLDHNIESSLKVLWMFQPPFIKSYSLVSQ